MVVWGIMHARTCFSGQAGLPKQAKHSSIYYHGPVIGRALSFGAIHQWTTTTGGLTPYSCPLNWDDLKYPCTSGTADSHVKATNRPSSVGNIRQTNSAVSCCSRRVRRSMAHVTDLIEEDVWKTRIVRY